MNTIIIIVAIKIILDDLGILCQEKIRFSIFATATPVSSCYGLIYQINIFQNIPNSNFPSSVGWTLGFHRGEKVRFTCTLSSPSVNSAAL